MAKRSKVVTRRPTYAEAVRWIAENDETSTLRMSEIVDLISVVLVADLFGAEPENVAIDVIDLRNGVGRFARYFRAVPAE